MIAIAAFSITACNNNKSVDAAQTEEKDCCKTAKEENKSSNNCSEKEEMACCKEASAKKEQCAKCAH